MRTRTRTHTYDYYQKILAITLFGVFIAFVVVYAHFVNSTVVHVVERDQLETDMTILATNISELEFEYINKKNNITLDFALARGFNEIEDPRYVSRDVARTLTLETR